MASEVGSTEDDASQENRESESDHEGFDVIQETPEEEVGTSEEIREKSPCSSGHAHEEQDLLISDPAENESFSASTTKEFAIRSLEAMELNEADIS